ncbi:MAG: S9 family peptidase [Sphingomonadales bacterium]|nr:S9 family peptidase [Sphingomonadales bacterium]MBD3773261.1 S9 family peptidase [Paracoccaceae bacterium]
MVSKRIAPRLFAVLFGASALGSPALANTVEQDAEAFGARQNILAVALSPSGDKLAYIAPVNGSGETIYVVDLANGQPPKAILSNSDVHTDIDYCQWASETRLVCNTSAVAEDAGVLVGFSRLIMVDADGRNLKSLTRTRSSRALGIRQDGGDIIALEVDGKPGKMLMTRSYLSEVQLGTRTANKESGLGVDLVDIDSLNPRKEVSPDPDAIDYIADDKGVVRIMARQPLSTLGRTGSERYYSYREADGGKWRDLSTILVGEGYDKGFRPIAVDAASNLAYGFDEKDGYQALYTMALDGSGATTLVMSRDDVDVDGLLRIGRNRRVIGGSFATERRMAKYFDPQLDKLAGALASALPGTPQIGIIDASEGEGKLLIEASSDVDPGTIYLFDKGSKQLNPLLSVRPQLDGRVMGKMTPVTFPAADGTQIPGYLTLPPGVVEAKGLPTIVMPHGGPGSRDEWGFDWLVQFFAARGYAVLQPNFRGSSGYGQAWFGRNGFKAWKTAIGDIDDAGRWLVNQGIANPDKLAIVGWSYGGYAALQSQVLEPGLYKAVVAIAPVTDLDLLREEARPYTNFSLVDKFIGNGPHVKEGSPAANVERFQAPVLLFHATSDQNVDVQQSREMRDRLEKAGKSVEYVEFQDLDHSLSDSNARQQMLLKAAQFLAAKLGR